MVQSTAPTRESLLNSQVSVLNHCEAQHLDIGAIESTFIVHEFHPLKQKWVKRTRTAFNVIIQDLDHSRSLVRYISDVMDFDRRIRAYDRKCKIPPPKLVEPQHLVAGDVYQTHSSHNTYQKRQHRRRQRLSLLLKKTIAGLRRKKSNSEKFEIYLRRCVLDPIIGRSSLLRDFLSAQRTEDKIMPLRAIIEHISLDHQQQQQQHLYHTAVVPDHVAPIAALPNCSTSSVSPSSISLSATSSCPIETEDTPLSTPPPLHLLHKEQSPDGLCEQSLRPPLPSSSSDAPIEEEEPEEPLTLMDGDDEKETKLTIHDFELIKVLGGGCTGKVLLVRRQAHRTNSCNKLLALKVIPKPQVFLRSQITHAKTERQILSLLSQRKHPFLVQLRYAFQDPSFLFLAFDFYAGGDLATQLKLHTRFPPERCRLYAAEMLLGIQELHRWGILYRDLKPENILIGADGHLVLTDFGLSKWTDDYDNNDSGDNMRRANTICGTPEYLAPEVVCGYPYGYEVDYWSYGTILYEMIDGFPPFWDEDPDVMYGRIVVAPLQFSSRRFDLATRDLLTKLLERDPDKRLGRDNAETRAHRYFISLDWAAVYDKRYRPQYVPYLDHPEDVSHFDQEFLDMPVECALEMSVAEAAGNNIPMDERSQTTMTEFDGYSFVNNYSDDDPMTTPAAAATTTEDGGESLATYPASLVNDLKSMPVLRDSNVTDPHPAQFLLGQQANHGGTTHYWYHTDDDVIPYDWMPESDMTGNHLFSGNGSAILSVVDYDDDDNDEESALDEMDVWPAPPPRPAAAATSSPSIGLSRHYGARQINTTAITATV